MLCTAPGEYRRTTRAAILISYDGNESAVGSLSKVISNGINVACRRRGDGRLPSPLIPIWVRHLPVCSLPELPASSGQVIFGRTETLKESH